MGRRLIVLAWTSCVLVGIVAGCQSTTPRATQAPDQGAAVGPRTALPYEALVAQAEGLRGQRFVKAPGVVVEEVEALAPEALPKPVAEDRARLEAWLWGPAGAGEGGAASTRHALARYDAARHVIVRVAHHGKPEALRQAVLGALCDALFEEASRAAGEVKAPTSWDGWLASRAARDGVTAFALVLADVRRQHPEASAELLARRPDLSWGAPLASGLFSATGEVDAALSGFTHREGMSLASALYRAQGASGAAVLQVIRPPTTAAVAHPDRWMPGEEETRWTLASAWGAKMGEQGWSRMWQGRVGAATGAALLGRALPGPQAWVVPAGWRADHVEVHRRGEDEVMTWLIQWETPHIAQRMAPLLQRALMVAPAPGDRAQQRPERGVQVVAQGLITVAQVVRASGDRQAVAARLAGPALLKDTRALTLTREGWSMAFTPSAGERLSLGAGQQRLDGETWRDDVLGLRMTPGALKGWEAELSQTPPVRWYARRGDELLQLTIELRDPFGPDFGSAAHTRQLVAAFQSSMPGATITTSAVADHALGRGVQLDISGKRGDQPHALTVWHFARGEYALTFSLSADAKTHREDLATARAILATLKPARDAEAAPREGAGRGIVQFKAE